MDYRSEAYREALANAIRTSSERLGISPVDLATAMSYETGGTLNPWQPGPRTQHGQHRGLIQFGEPQRQTYGVYEGMPVADHVVAAENYLRDRGVKPGMGLLDVYSTINAGRPGLYNRSDANNGGAPGTVADKVAGMGAHRQAAARLLGMEVGSVPAVTASPAVGVAPGAPAGSLPLSLAGAAPEGDSAEGDLLAKLSAYKPPAEPDFGPQPEFQRIRMASPPGLARARAFARAMGSMQLG